MLMLVFLPPSPPSLLPFGLISFLPFTSLNIYLPALLKNEARIDEAEKHFKQVFVHYLVVTFTAMSREQ